VNDQAPSPHEVQSTLHAIVVGCIIGAIVAFAAVFTALILSGHAHPVGLGIGGMAALWGGCGFGSMIGGALHLMRHPDE
jgi:hypothetical protein